MSLADVNDLSHVAAQVATFQQVPDLPPSFLYRFKAALAEQEAKIALLERNQREQIAKLEERVQSKQEEVVTLQKRVVELESKWGTLEANIKRVFTNFSELIFGKAAEHEPPVHRPEESEQPALAAQLSPPSRPGPAPSPLAARHVVNKKNKEDPQLAELRQIFRTEKNAVQGIGNKRLISCFKSPIDRAQVKMLCKKLEAEKMIELRGSGSARKWYLLKK